MSGLSLKRVDEILERIADRRAMVVGDIMLDRYVWGLVSRISPEAPVPIVDVHEETSRLGGAANVANNIVSLGASCDLLGIVGDDQAGRDLVAKVGEAGIRTENVIRDAGRPTTVKTRVIAHNQQVVRTDLEVRDEIGGEVGRVFSDAVVAGLERCDAVLISDYGKGVITRALLDALIPRARSEGKVISVDPKDTHFMNYRGVSLITPNQYEAGGAVGMRIHDEESLLDVGWKITKELDTDALLITRGAEGMSLFQKNGTYSHFPTVARRVYDVTGAGDTVICAFTLALCAGARMDEAAHIANHAAGLVIRDLGTATVTREALSDSFRDLGSPTTDV
jgi:D-beta-D-heptose 7-phosphate kinase/D-beta-D-heptose 1-phosphate adenosyltransferase